MKKINLLLIFGLILILLSSCKKDKLTGDANVLVGTWQWVETPYPYQSPSTAGYTMTLILKEKGNYEIEKNGKKIEGGRLILQELNTALYAYQFYLEFKNNDLFSKKQTFRGQCGLNIIGSDTLYMQEDYVSFDTPSHIYVRQK